jgi:hypothetical protein
MQSMEFRTFVFTVFCCGAFICTFLQITLKQSPARRLTLIPEYQVDSRILVERSSKLLHPSQRKPPPRLQV